jgi:hypothetical protein
MVTMLGWFSAEAARLLLEALQPIGVDGARGGSTLSATRRFSRVSSAQ